MYIVASSKPWNRASFDQATKFNSSQWCYVSTPVELERALDGDTGPRYLFFLHWNWKVPSAIWELHECVCFHMTDLPYGRGGSPLQNLIMEGKKNTQVTALRMVEKMDAGPVYAKRLMSLDGRAEEIYLRAGNVCWEMIEWIINNEPLPKPQHGQPTHFSRRKPKQSALPLQVSLPRLYDFIRMLDAPTYPLAFIEHGDFRLEFSHPQLSKDVLKAHVTIRRKSNL
jgi:methionyl-tRNA formyltransferase